MLRRLLRRFRRRGPEPDRMPHKRAHLVFEDGSIVQADLDPETQAQVDYLARRVVAPPPPKP